MSNFVLVKNTWDTNSSLKMTKWDPYPELRNQKDVYGNQIRECYQDLRNNLNYKKLDTTQNNQNKYNL